MVDVPQNGLPPFPWPLAPSDGYWQNCSPGGDTCLGEPGTPWVFKLSELQARLLALGVGSSLIETAAQIIGYANTLLARWNAGTCAAEVDDPEDPDPRLLYVAPEIGGSVSVDCYRTIVHATLGPAEDLAHVFHLVPKGGVTQDSSSAGLSALAARVGAAWTDWWNDTTSSNGLSGATKANFVTQLAYDKITITYVSYPGSNAKPTPLSGTTQWNFSTPLAGTSTTNTMSLPNEVACCVTLLTDTSGRRTRGRFYLGGLDPVAWMDAFTTPANYGLFKTSTARGVAGRFGTLVVGGLHDDATAQAELNVVSRVGGSARGVGGIKVGVVPDSQRRRRWHQQENKTLVWGTNS